MSAVPKEWLSYAYYDPAIVLPRMKVIREGVGRSGLDDRIKNLRTNQLKEVREGWDAAVFTLLLSLANGSRIQFCPKEAADFDAILWSQGDTYSSFAPLQLKELVPADLNPNASLQALIDGLVKYGSSETLIVAIKLNRRERIEFSGLDTSALKIGGLWCFGATSYDQSRWTLWGDFLNDDIRRYEFDVPCV